MPRTNWKLGPTLILVALALVLTAAGFAQENDPAAVQRVARVDMDRLLGQYKEFQTADQSLQQWIAECNQWLGKLGDYLFLPEEEFSTALEILRGGAPTEEEQQKLDELRQISTTNEERFLELQNNPQRSTQENAEYNTLLEMREARDQQAAQLQDQLMQEFANRRDAAASGLRDKVRSAIVAEAKASGYDLVLDADAVFFGSEDITDRVAERLNAGVADGGEGGETGTDGAADGGEDGGQDGGEGGGE